MSSIDSMNSNLSAMTPSSESDAWSQLTPEERKLLEKAKAQEGVSDVTGLLGMTSNQMAGVASNVKDNKFTQVGASRYLPPPSAPKVQVTQRQIDAYHSMSQDVSTALNHMSSNLNGVYLRTQKRQPAQGTEHGAHGAHAAQHHATASATNPAVSRAVVPGQGQAEGTGQQQGNGPVDPSTLGGVGSSTMTWAQAENGGKGSAAVQQLSKYIQSALGSMNSSDMMTAFLALQVTSQNDGLSTRQSLSNLTSQMRQSDLENEIKQDKEAEASVQKALAKAKKMGVLTKVLAVLTVILTAVLAVLTMGVGIGLALVAAAMLIGGIAGGAKQGQKNGDGFDMEGFLNGAAMGGDIAMAAFGGLEIMAALETTAATTAKVMEDAGANAAKTAAKGAADAGKTAARSSTQQAMLDAKDAVAESINKAIKSIAEKTGVKAMADTTKELLETMVKSAPVQAVGKGAGKAAGSMRGKTMPMLTPKGLMAATVGSIAVQSGGQVAQATINYQSNRYNLDSEYYQQQAAIEQKMADTWEEEYQNLQDYMQNVSQSHSKAVNQAMSMLTSHFQSGMRAAQNIAG